MLNYGESWDNVLMLRVGRANLNIYQNPLRNYTIQDYGPYDTRYFGPVLVTFGVAVSTLLSDFGLPWQPLDVLRYIYFLSFLLGAASLYSLSKHYMGSLAAFAVFLLFVTQPLLFGQSLSNAKDIPFMGFFIAAVAMGVKLFKNLEPKDDDTRIPESSGGFKKILSLELQNFTQPLKTNIRWFVIVWGTVLVSTV
ncbi:MAG: hypothetical protein N2D54_06170, partial [Chloroflexota bacterium]